MNCAFVPFFEVRQSKSQNFVRCVYYRAFVCCFDKVTMIFGLRVVIMWSFCRCINDER
jgi:hypothetical protein